MIITKLVLNPGRRMYKYKKEYNKMKLKFFLLWD